MVEALQLLCQPVALVAWGLVAAVWASWRAPAPPAVRRLVTALLLLYLAAATPLGANLAVGALEGEAAPAAACVAEAPRSAIVVLAGGMSGVPAGEDDVARLQIATVRRVFAALALARSTGVPVILSGGAGSDVREADLMASLVTSLGLPPGRVLRERESTTTAESAANVAGLLARRGVAAPGVHLVTSALHMPRAAAAFRRRGMEVCPVPVDRRRVTPAAHEALIPQITALEKSTAAFHEAVGYVVYRATGRL